jgi:hypothetical protein
MATFSYCLWKSWDGLRIADENYHSGIDEKTRLIRYF